MMIEILLAAVSIMVLVIFTHQLHPLHQITVAQINAMLPQTQCGRCGYAGCKNYATALVANSAKSNLCPPGGNAVKQAIESILPNTSTIESLHVTPNQGTADALIPLVNLATKYVSKPANPEPTDPPQVAIIDADMCIGCVLCVTQCPTGAIIGTRGSSHHVTEHLCTGCDLCVSICPTNCIVMTTDDSNARDAINWSVEQQKNADLKRYDDLWQFEATTRKPLNASVASPTGKKGKVKTSNVQLNIAKATLKKFIEQKANQQQIDAMQAQVNKLENN